MSCKGETVLQKISVLGNFVGWAKRSVPIKAVEDGQAVLCLSYNFWVFNLDQKRAARGPRQIGFVAHSDRGHGRMAAPPLLQ